jgi:hypothetical protein
MQGLAYCWYVAENLPADVVIPVEVFPDLVEKVDI